jgi:calcineurin-like phosphoesterase family protein
MSRKFNENEFAIGDTHFGHSRILDMEYRPFINIEEHDEQLIQNWNSVVHKKDKIWHLGDVSFYGKEKTKQIISRLNGYKILCKGNHDNSKSAKWWMEVGFNEVYSYPFIRNGVIFSHCIPPEEHDCYFIHAHLHSSKGSAYQYDKYDCVSVENYDYKPVRIMDILRKWNLDEYGERKDT